jgi:PAS domain S-box-containing protein
MSEDFYRAVLENVPWGAIVASTDLGGRCRYVNPEFTRLTGYRLDHVPTVRDWIERAYPEP